MRSEPITTKGSGDIAEAQVRDDEAEGLRWIRLASEAELRARGVCGTCRGAGCEACGDSGEYVRCRQCGEQIAPDEVSMVGTLVLCSGCASPGELSQ